MPLLLLPQSAPAYVPRGAQLADALVSSLNATTFSLPFTASRAWRKRYKLDEDFATLQVNVAPRARETARLTRAADQDDHALDVTIRQLVQGDTDDDREDFIDARAYLAEEIADHAGRLRLTAAGQSHPCVGCVIDPLAAIDDLDEHGLFTSVVTATFREVREVT